MPQYNDDFDDRSPEDEEEYEENYEEEYYEYDSDYDSEDDSELENHYDNRENEEVSQGYDQEFVKLLKEEYIDIILTFYNYCLNPSLYNIEEQRYLEKNELKRVNAELANKTINDLEKFIYDSRFEDVHPHLKDMYTNAKNLVERLAEKTNDKKMVDHNTALIDLISLGDTCASNHQRVNYSQNDPCRTEKYRLLRSITSVESENGGKTKLTKDLRGILNTCDVCPFRYLK